MMRNYKLGFVVLLMLAIAGSVQAQRTTFLKINEVLVINEDNYMDDYGKKSPWIELYNASPGTVDVGGCFLTNDKNNPRKYPIPKGDILTKIKPRQHILFWADGNPHHGTFHLSFQLDPAKENYLALYDSDGRTLIDEVTIPAGQRPDVSYGLVEDGWTQARLDEELRLNAAYNRGDKLWVQYERVTPSTNNVTLDKNVKVESFKENDANGIGMTITAMSVVFIGLVILFLIFKTIGNTAVRLSQKRAMKASGLTREQAKDLAAAESGEIYAAIAMAIHEINNSTHDEENTILTIKNVARNYSPWSSKIYTLRNFPK